MKIPEELSSPVKKALYRLSMGDLTVEEMVSYLSDPHRKNTGFSEEIARRTADLLVAEGYLDDKRYFLLYLKKLDQSLFGPRKIRRELVRHRFPSSYIEAAMNRKIAFEKRACQLLLRKNQASSLAKTPAGRKKLSDWLVRQGYDYSVAAVAISKISGEDLDSD